MRSFITNHKLAVGGGTAVLVAGLAWLAFGFFGVHTLFIDDVVDESGPVFDATPAALDVETTGSATEPPDTTEPPRTTEPAAAETQAAEPTATTATDTATATDVADTADAGEFDEAAPEPTAPSTEAPAAPQIVTEYVGTFVSEDHPTSGTATVLGNGTGQRFVRFENFGTDNGPDLNVYLFDDDTGEFVDLGDLKGNIGDQNYEIPVDVDLDRFDRVSVWCVRFGVGFGSAELMAT